MAVEDEQGRAKTYSLSTRWTPTVLREWGWSNRSITAGDTIVASYIPYKQDDTLGELVTLVVNGKAFALNASDRDVGAGDGAR
jgi:hypothetical protein